PLHTEYLRVETEFYPLTTEGFLHKRGSLRVLAIEQVPMLVEQADLRTQPLEGLRQFAPNGSASNNGQPGRTLGKAEDGLVGQEARLNQSRDWRLRWPCPRPDDCPFEPQRFSRNLNRNPTGKTGLTQKPNPP